MRYHAKRTYVIDGDPETGYAVFGASSAYPYAVFFEGPEGSRQNAKELAEKFKSDNYTMFHLQIIRVTVPTMTPLADGE